MELDGAAFAGGAAGGPPPRYGVPGSDASFGAMDEDPELARAIEASYAAQTSAGMADSEADLLEQAIRLSKLEEEARQRKEAGLPEDEDQAAILAALAESEGSAAMAGTFDSSSVPAVQPMMPPVQPMMPPRMHREEDMSSYASSLPPGARGVDDEMAAAQAVAMEEEMSDRQLAAAIEASYTAQTADGMAANEEDLIAQALRVSKQEDDNRQRASLRQEQEQELQESILMDQMRVEQEKKRRLEEEQLQALEASRLEEEAARKRAEEEAKVASMEQKRARIPAEPAAGEPGRADLMIRTPDGKRIRRAFRGSDTVGLVYDFIDIEGNIGDLNYRLVSTMPRRVYEDREQSLEAAGLQGQSALNVESIST